MAAVIFCVAPSLILWLNPTCHTPFLFILSLLSGQRSYGYHRCVTPLYRIPMWIFDCVLDGDLDGDIDCVVDCFGYCIAGTGRGSMPGVFALPGHPVYRIIYDYLAPALQEPPKRRGSCKAGEIKEALY